MSGADPSHEVVRTTELAELDTLLHTVERVVTLDELVRSGRREFRVVSRKQLVADLLGLIEVFVRDRVERAERRLGSLVQRRETEAREEGRLRVLDSLVDLGDLVDGVVGRLAGAGEAAAARALDQRLDGVFRTHGFARIPTVGHRFDSSRHEIVSEEPSPDVAEGEILRETGRGYHCEDFVLRPARVVVSGGND